MAQTQATPPTDFGTPPPPTTSGSGTQGTPKHINTPPIGVPWSQDAQGNVIPYEAENVQTGVHIERQQGLDPGETPRSVTTPTIGNVSARYFTGDEFLPASWPPDQISAYQQSLVHAGLLTANGYQSGVWDQTSIKAYQQLLGAANASGLTKEAMLARWDASHTANPQEANGPLTVRTTNPDDLRKVFRAAIIDTLGEGWDSAKIDQMVAGYQAAQTTAQTQEHALSTTGGSVTGPPSPQTFAETQARTENPLGAQEHDLLTGPLQSFKQMLAGWQ